MQRATIGILTAWDVVSGRNVKLPAGVMLGACRIARSQREATYMVEFEIDGRPYRCPLSKFQPRTEILETAGEASVR